MKTNHELLLTRIDEVAQELETDYPNIATIEPLEQFWAIEQGYRGTLLANKDLHEILDSLRQKLGWSKIEMADYGIKVMAEDDPWEDDWN